MSRYSYSEIIRIRLRRLRKTQYQLADALGYSPSYLSMLLSGKLKNLPLRSRIDAILRQWEQECTF